MNEIIATGFDCEPLPDGNVLVEFFGDDGHTFNKQVVSPEVIKHMPLVAVLTEVALTKGPVVAKEIMDKLNQERPGTTAERSRTMSERSTPNWDAFGGRKILVPFFVYGREDAPDGPLEGFCRGYGSLGQEESYENTIGIYTAEGVYFNILIDTRLECVMPMFFIDGKPFSYPIVACFTMCGGVPGIDPDTGIMRRPHGQ